MSERICGPCTTCCTHLRVEALDKDEGVPCIHLTPQGCGIYEDRPEECRRFTCAYLSGIGDLTTRPDRMGYVLYPEEPNGRITAATGRRRRGRKLPVFVRRQILASVERTGAAAVITPGHREVWCRSDRIEQHARQWCAERGLHITIRRTDR